MTTGVDPDLYIEPELLVYLTDDELAEYLNLLQICARIDGTWTLQPRQRKAEDLCDQLMAEGVPFELLYGGAGAGGKSEWLLWHLHNLARRFPGFSGLLIRTTHTELERTAILRSLARFDRSEATYNATKRRWTFTNGSTIEFGYLDSDHDVFQYDSAEYDVVAWDELTQFPTDYPYRYMFTRLRTSITQSIRGFTPHVIAGTNPHRTGVAWVKPRWVDLGPPEAIYEIHTELDDGQRRMVKRVFIPAKMADNRFVDADAYRAGLSLADEATRKAIEEGSWDVIEGQYFNEWNRELHVIRPFAIPGWWTKITGLDFGIAKPYCNLWGAFDGDGACYIYRETYETGMTPKQQAGQVLGLEQATEKVDYRVADPSIWVRTGAGPPIAQQYGEAGLHCRKANNARVDGWARLREFLRLSRPVTDDDTGLVTLAPSMFIFSTCSNLIRTLPLLVHDDKKPEDVDTDGEDHAPDALRYLLMSRPRGSKNPAPPPVKGDRVGPRHTKDGPGFYDHPVLGRVEM